MCKITFKLKEASPALSPTWGQGTTRRKPQNNIFLRLKNSKEVSGNQKINKGGYD